MPILEFIREGPPESPPKSSSLPASETQTISTPAQLPHNRWTLSRFIQSVVAFFSGHEEGHERNAT
ncbi:hypothetical protein C8R44DRAFT_882851 [Mycena epipterygia]|nr:hypothetical protein C8R44DRAFT_882851 [Mycena epipterygia]